MTNGTDGLDQFIGPNAGYVLELWERYRQDPRSVEPTMRALFAAWSPGSAGLEATSASATLPEVPSLAPSAHVPSAAGAAALAQAIRYFGHLGARIDPLGSAPPGDGQLLAATHGVSEVELERLPASVVGDMQGTPAGARNALEAMERLRRLYCSTTGYELGHVQAAEERAWLLEAIESERYRPPRMPLDERALLDRLTEISAFERFLHRAYPGQTRFSVEGLGMLIPMLDEMVACAASAGVGTILLGMAHRGRLNVLAHVLGKPYERILAEFEGHLHAERLAPPEGTDEGWTGDVKYHAGARREHAAAEDALDGRGESVAVVMVPNPSHLEYVNPVVQGMARAAARGDTDALAVLIHGDASFAGQGIVAETLNLSRLAGYSTGGTLHLIANNQLGFTTEPGESRSTLYASDPAKGFEIPIVHVNADDPVACLAAMRLAVAYRARFHKDVLIDLVGYRRWGHNEGDEPSFTQPRLYEAVRAHPTVRELFGAKLVQRGALAEGEPEALLRAGLDEFQRIRESVLALTRARGGDQVGGEQSVAPAEVADSLPGAVSGAREAAAPKRVGDGEGEVVPAGALAAPNGVVGEAKPGVDARDRVGQAESKAITMGVELGRLRALNEALVRLPEGFHLHPKLERPLQRRRAAFGGADATMDWGHVETLALASILADGTPIRLTGQDVVRGTFSQRHLTFYDARDGTPFTPLCSLPEAADGGTFEVHNSPLTESACVGFEYGYSVQAPSALVVWEAQYGDFINGAQVILDEFVASGEAKWGLQSGLVLLLPHAWEGQGPDHSSGRLERFLQLAAEDNLVVANCSTAAQYFHLLRRQADWVREGAPRPLVVMTPKSLLRHPLAAARAEELAVGRFAPVLDDARAAEKPGAVRRVILCSGKVWVDAEMALRQRDDASRTALVRLEQIYPFPSAEVRSVLERYGKATEVVWLQEEPRNMGAWWFVEPYLRESLEGLGRTAPRYVGRPDRASPAEGWADVHALEQRRIVESAIEAQGKKKVVSHAG